MLHKAGNLFYRTPVTSADSLLHGPPQFVLLVALLATTLTLLIMSNRLLDRLLKLSEPGSRSRRERHKLILQNEESLARITATVFLQFCVAILLTVRISLSALAVEDHYFDLIIVLAFTVTILCWMIMFLKDYSGRIHWSWVFPTLAVLVAALLYFVVSKRMAIEPLSTSHLSAFALGFTGSILLFGTYKIPAAYREPGESFVGFYLVGLALTLYLSTLVAKIIF